MLQENTQTADGVTLSVFDPVTVQISIDRSNIQHQKLRLQLVKPVVSIQDEHTTILVAPMNSKYHRYSLKS